MSIICWPRVRRMVPWSYGICSERVSNMYKVKQANEQLLRIKWVRSPSQQLNRQFTEVVEHVLSEHRRAVNRVAWHPTDTNILLSGSQDSTIKLWVRGFTPVLCLGTNRSFFLTLENGFRCAWIGQTSQSNHDIPTQVRECS